MPQTIVESLSGTIKRVPKNDVGRNIELSSRDTLSLGGKASQRMRPGHVARFAEKGAPEFRIGLRRGIGGRR